MRPPNPILIHKAGVRNTLDFAILWHLALCGLTGANIQDLQHASGSTATTLRGSLTRLETHKLIVGTPNRDLPGHPLTYVCSRFGYRLMTGHLKQTEKDNGGQLPMGSEIIHNS